MLASSPACHTEANAATKENKSDTGGHRSPLQRGCAHDFACCQKTTENAGSFANAQSARHRHRQRRRQAGNLLSIRPNGLTSMVCQNTKSIFTSEHGRTKWSLTREGSTPADASETQRPSQCRGRPCARKTRTRPSRSTTRRGHVAAEVPLSA